MCVGEDWQCGLRISFFVLASTMHFVCRMVSTAEEPMTRNFLSVSHANFTAFAEDLPGMFCSCLVDLSVLIDQWHFHKVLMNSGTTARTERTLQTSVRLIDALFACQKPTRIFNFWVFLAIYVRMQSRIDLTCAYTSAS